MSELHPDGGNESEQEEYQRMASAMEWLKRRRKLEVATIAVDQLPAIVRELQKASRPPERPKSEVMLRETRSDAVLFRQQTYSLPKISSAAIAAVALFLSAFPAKVSEILIPANVPAGITADEKQKYLEFIAEKQGQIGLWFLVIAAVAGVAFAVTWFMEQLQAAATEEALSSEMRESFLFEVSERGQRSEFSEREFARVVAEYISNSTPFLLRSPFFLPRRLNNSLAAKIASAHIQELIEAQLISLATGKAIDKRYRLSDEVVNELASNRSMRPHNRGF